MDTSLKYVCDARLAEEDGVMWLDYPSKWFTGGEGMIRDELVKTLKSE
jgi:hypothetical protein